jgi:hypothetical protein
MGSWGGGEGGVGEGLGRGWGGVEGGVVIEFLNQESRSRQIHKQHSFFSIYTESGINGLKTGSDCKTTGFDTESESEMNGFKF